MNAVRIPVEKHGEVVAYAVVDAQDSRLARHRWKLDRDGYARRNTTINGRAFTVLLHREIMGLVPGDGMEIDHENRDRLDCRRENLRVATRYQQMQNRIGGWGTSLHRGVYWSKKEGKWRVQVRVNHQTHNLGSFADEEVAAAVASAFRAEHMPHSPEAMAA